MPVDSTVRRHGPRGPLCQAGAGESLPLFPALSRAFPCRQHDPEHFSAVVKRVGRDSRVEAECDRLHAGTSMDMLTLRRAALHPSSTLPR